MRTQDLICDHFYNEDLMRTFGIFSCYQRHGALRQSASVVGRGSSPRQRICSRCADRGSLCVDADQKQGLLNNKFGVVRLMFDDFPHNRGRFKAMSSKDFENVRCSTGFTGHQKATARLRVGQQVTIR